MGLEGPDRVGPEFGRGPLILALTLFVVCSMGPCLVYGI